MKIKEKNLLDFIILYWMIIYIFAISWFAYLMQGALVLAVLIIIRLLLDIKRTLRFSPFYFGLMVSFVYPLFSYLAFDGNLITLYNNIIVILPSTLALIYVGFLCKYKRDFIICFLKKQKMIFNGYMLLNVPVLLLQLGGNTFLAGRHPESLNNSYAADLISGLFGYNGTALLAMYFCFLIVYNISLYKNGEIKHTQIFSIYNVLLIIFIMFVAANSDNKAIFIIMPMFLIIYLVEHRMIINMTLLKKIRQLLKYVIYALAVVFTITIIISPVISVDEIFKDTFQKIYSGWLLSNNAHGSAERLGMISYALSNTSIRWFGAGIAKYGWQEPYAFHFSHFGISDLGSFLCLGGGMYIFLIMFFCINLYRQIVHDKISIFILLMGAFAILLYTQFLTVLSAMCSWCFFILTISSDRISYKKNLCQRKKIKYSSVEGSLYEYEI